MTSTGECEIPGIKHDIMEKLCSSKAEHNLMIILSANPRNQTINNIKWLSEHLNLAQTSDHAGWATYSFPTVNRMGEEVEFWVAGYEIQQSPHNIAGMGTEISSST